jgi:hypothetical protein
MIYRSADDWLNAPQKRILFFGMSGLGKTYLSNLLRDQGDWFHYSIDYRIGTRYMGEYIADNAKREAMKVPFLRDLLMTDSIQIRSNITFENLNPVSAYLGKPGNVDKGGLPYDEYVRRQGQFRQAEVKALMDTPYFIERAEALYGYPHFICDTGGSICEWVDPEDPDNPILKMLANNTLLVWLKGSEDHTEELIRRFDKAPKPMSYQAAFLDRVWNEYLHLFQMREEQVDPDEFIRWTYAQALAHRQPRYEAMARNWGVTLHMDEVAQVKSADDFDKLIAMALERSVKPA